MAEQLLGSEMTLLYDSSVIAYATDLDMEVNKESIEVTSLASNGWKEFKTDLKDWSVSFNGLVTKTDSSTSIDYDDLMYDIKNSTSAVTVAIKPNVSSNKYEEGTGYLTSLKMSGAVGDKVTFSGSIQGTGELTTKTE